MGALGIRLARCKNHGTKNDFLKYCLKYMYDFPNHENKKILDMQGSYFVTNVLHTMYLLGSDQCHLKVSGLCGTTVRALTIRRNWSGWSVQINGKLPKVAEFKLQ